VQGRGGLCVGERKKYSFLSKEKERGLLRNTADAAGEKAFFLILRGKERKGGKVREQDPAFQEKESPSE